MVFDAARFHEYNLRDTHPQLCNKVLPEFGMRPPSRRACHRWLQKLGYSHKVFKKGIYTDVHESEMVVKYREKTFLPLLAHVRKAIKQYEVCSGMAHSEHIILYPNLFSGLPLYAGR